MREASSTEFCPWIEPRKYASLAVSAQGRYPACRSADPFTLR